MTRPKYRRRSPSTRGAGRQRVEEISEQAAKTNSGKTNGAAATFVFGLLMPVLRRTILVPERMFGPVHRFRIDWDEVASAG